MDDESAEALTIGDTTNFAKELEMELREVTKSITLPRRGRGISDLQHDTTDSLGITELDDPFRGPSTIINGDSETDPGLFDEDSETDPGLVDEDSETDPGLVDEDSETDPRLVDEIDDDTQDLDNGL